jgi:hypothetical protein
MGRQLQMLMTQEDIRDLISFVHQTSPPIRVFVSHAAQEAELWVNEWDTCSLADIMYYVWPTKFAWTPVLKQTGGPRCRPPCAGQWYIANTTEAPVLEICASIGNGNGRVYWSRDFAAPDGLGYDANEFSKLVDRVWNWIRRKGVKQPGKDSRWDAYCMPHYVAKTVSDQEADA